MKTSTQPMFVTIKEASKIIGLQYRQLLVAANQGEIPTYRLRKSRRLVRVEEVISMMHSKPNH